MSKKVLTIESDDDFLRSLTRAFTGKGFEVQGTSDWNEGLSMARDWQPDLILVAVELPPPANGYSVCTKLKKDDDLKSIPVVLMSSNATPETFEKHKKLKTRAEDYIIKPFEMPELFDKVGALVGMPEVEEVVESDGEGIAPVEEMVGDEAITADDVEEVAGEDVVPDESLTMGGDQSLEEVDAAFGSIAPGSEEGNEEPTAIKMAPSKVARTARPLDDDDEGPKTIPSMEPVEEDEPFVETRAVTADAATLEKLADLEGTVKALEEALAEREAELEAARSTRSDAHNLRSEITRRDKEILRLKEEVNSKDKEILTAQERADELERGKSDAESEAARKESLLKNAQKNLEAAQNEKKKAEREVSGAREQVSTEKKARELQSRLDDAESRISELQGAHAELEEAQQNARTAAEEVERLKSQVAELEADAARNEERVVKAYQKIKGDEKMKERTKKALQIAMQLLEEQQAMDEDAPATDAD